MSSRSDKRRKTKVKKSSEKVSEKPKLEDGEAPTTKREPIKTDPERIELLQKRLNDVSSRSHKFAREIERLRAEARKHTFDADKMIKWLEEQVKRKDMANKKLTKHLKEFTELQEK